MYYWKIFIAVSALWLGLEIYLALGRKARNSSAYDRGSTAKMWVVISLSLAGGIYFAFSGLGALGCCLRTFSALGIGLIVLGQSIRLVAINTLKKFFTTNVAILPGHRLVKRGVYRIIRHPAYLGDILSFAGLGIAFCNWLSFLFIFFPAAGVFLYRIKLEEEALVSAFGQEYLSYMERTYRLLPGIY